MILFSRWEGIGEQGSISRFPTGGPCPVSLVPCPLSPAPFNKNEGASGDMYENKGRRNWIFDSVPGQGASASGAPTHSRPRPLVPCPLPLTPPFVPRKKAPHITENK